MARRRRYAEGQNGVFIAERRARFGSQPRLAAAARCSVSFVQKVENNRCRPGVMLAARFARLLGRTVDELWPDAVDAGHA